MPYGSIKVDNIVFTNGGSDQTVTVSGLVASTSGSLTVTGTVSGNIIQGGTLVSGATVTGGIGQFTTLTGGTAGFTTITGTTVTGTTANFASGNFTNISGGIYTITSGVFASGTAANPSISFAGDSNTGIYASAVDQVSITTSGTERLRVDAAGQIEAVSLGSASAPTYSFTTDPNTGIYSPGADQLAISSSGVGRVFVDASGNVGVGAATIRAQVHIAGVGQSTANLTDAGGRGGMLRLSGTGASGGEGGALLFTNNQGDFANSLGFAAIKGLLTDGSNNTAGDLAFATRATSAATSLQERLRITSAGLVGVGTSVPNQPLHVVGNARFTAALLWAGTGATNSYVDGGTTGLLKIGSNDRDRIKINATEITFNDATSEFARIDSSGRLGIGTSTPGTVGGGATLNIDQAGGSRFVIGGSSRRFFVNGASGADDLRIGARISSDTTDFNIITLLPGGNVGIGTASPAYKLHINASADDNVLLNTAGSGYAAYFVANGGGRSGLTGALTLISFNDASATITNKSNAALTFGTNDTERARIDSFGRLLVGTSTSLGAGLLQIKGSGDDVVRMQGDGFVGLNIVANRDAGTEHSIINMFGSRGTGATPSILGSADNIATFSFRGYDGSGYTIAARIDCFVDGAPGLNDMPGRLVFSTTADGASSPTERFRITNDGVIAHDQPAPAAVNATATLTVANLKAGIITSTSAAATDMTLPTGTDTQAGFSSTYDNFTFEWSVINTGPSLVRVLAGTAHTVVGSGSVATGTSGRFASRRTAANTFVTYRLS